MLRLIHQVVEDCRAKESISVNCIWPSGGQFATSAAGVLWGGASRQELQTDREVPHLGGWGARKIYPGTEPWIV